jgi:uncharacterized membrane protein
MKRAFSTVVELVGFALVLGAAFWWDLRAGMAVLGVLLVLTGFLLDRPRQVSG